MFQYLKNKQSFFQEFLDLIGAGYEKMDFFEISEPQKKILMGQNNISLEECTDAADFYRDMKEKYEL